MRQVFLEAGSVLLRDVCQPVLDDHSVLVSVHYSFISSGTELATLEKSGESLFFSNIPWKMKKVLQAITTDGFAATKALVKGKIKGEVQALGYSCSGRVIAVGKKVTSLTTGDFVACAGSGYALHADIVCVPEHLATLVSHESHLKGASITTIGSIALQGIRRAKVQLGETVAVVGLGLLGQLTVQLAKLSGCTVIGIDLVAERLEIAQASGAYRVFHGSETDLVNEIQYLTHRRGVDATIITAASKSDIIVQQAMEITRKKGRVVVVGDVGLALERNPFYTKEIDFLISCSYGPGRYDPVYEQQGQDYPFAYVRWTEQRNMAAFVELIERGQLNIDLLLSHELSVNNIKSAYNFLNTKQGLGVVLHYGDKLDLEIAFEDSDKILPAKKIKPYTFTGAHKDMLRVGLIGAGGFAKVKLMPLIAQLPSVTLDAVVDTNITNSLNMSKLYGGARVLTDDRELFKDDLVDVVVIASPHKFHASQALTALEQGKAVFLEKPMVTDFEQFEEFTSFLTAHPDARFCVDYNRSAAPFIKKIKHALNKRSTPVIIHYRMNAGYIPKEHWIQTEVGAGRIIGEACHIFDLFYFLINARARSVSVEALHAPSSDLFSTDNFSAQISFEDGSIATLVYTSLGHKSQTKERMELFFDGKSIEMDDYVTLKGYGLPSSFNETMRSQDKGHSALLSSFFAAIKEEIYVSPISIERLKDVAHIALVIDQLACQGGGEKEL